MSFRNSYKTALVAVSERTRTPLPSLLLSFGILHEVTAVVPLVGIFYASRGLGVGEKVVALVQQNGNGPQNESIAMTTLQRWMAEGELWAAKVGRRYGVFGFEKGSLAKDADPTNSDMRIRFAGDVANAVVAYAGTKALIPVRIGVSLYLAPAFSRGIVEPLRRTFMGLFRVRRDR